MSPNPSPADVLIAKGALVYKVTCVGGHGNGGSSVVGATSHGGAGGAGGAFTVKLPTSFWITDYRPSRDDTADPNVGGDVDETA